MLICFLVFSVSAVSENNLTPGADFSVEIEAGKPSYLYFEPSVSGVYAFTSLSECDTLCTLYDGNMNELLFDDDGGDTSNFYLEYDFEEGKRYVFSVWYYGEKINYDMTVILKPVKAEETHIHSYTQKVSKVSTCDTEGIIVFTCICGDFYNVTTDKLSHSYDTVQSVSADCTSKGVIREKCRLCGFEKSTALNALGHSFSDVFTTDVLPTCTTVGYASRHCIRCDKTTDVTVIEKTEHIPEPDFETVSEATCTAKGEQVRRCTVCEKILETASLEKVPHLPADEYEIIKEATCTSVGQKVKRCAQCNKKLETVSIDKTEHIPCDEYETVKLPTCTANGENTRRCKLCNTVVTRVKVEKLGHSYSTDYFTDKKASLSESGKKSRHCVRCLSKTDAATIPKIKTVKLSKDIYIYNGKTKTPEVTVKNSKGEYLKENRDYTVSLQKEKNIGSYSVLVRFKGNYEGESICYYSVVPSDISGLSCTQKQNSIRLKWNKCKGTVKYRIYLKNNKTSRYKLIGETEKNTFTVKKLKSGTEYTFSVKAVKKVNGKLYKNQKACRITASTKPKAVTLKAVSERSRHLKLSWNKTACDGYEIYKYDSTTGQYVRFKTIKKKDTEIYERTDMKSGKTYKFKIRSFKKSGDKILYSSFSKTTEVNVMSKIF